MIWSTNPFGPALMISTTVSPAPEAVGVSNWRKRWPVRRFTQLPSLSGSIWLRSPAIDADAPNHVSRAPGCRSEPGAI